MPIGSVAELQELDFDDEGNLVVERDTSTHGRTGQTAPVSWSKTHVVPTPQKERKHEKAVSSNEQIYTEACSEVRGIVKQLIQKQEKEKQASFLEDYVAWVNLSTREKTMYIDPEQDTTLEVDGPKAGDKYYVTARHPTSGMFERQEHAKKIEPKDDTTIPTWENEARADLLKRMQAHIDSWVTILRGPNQSDAVQELTVEKLRELAEQNPKK